MARVLRLRKEMEAEPAAAGRVGEKLLEARLITHDQLQIALYEQRRTGRMLGTLLVALGFLHEDKLAEVLAERSGYASIDLKTALIDPALMQKLPKPVAARCRVMPVGLEDNRLELAMADPYDIVAMDEIRRYFPQPIELLPRVAAAADIAEVLQDYDDSRAVLDEILAELEAGEVRALAHENWEHPVVRLVNAVLADGVRRGASDIHFEPEHNCVRLRYRVDGVLQQVRALHAAHWPELSHRIKIMAGLNIADQRSLQDGRFEMAIAGGTVDFRVAVMPVAEGENIVVRILDRRRALLTLEKLGYSGQARTELDRVLERPEGIILVTGPTGCGKTTTLYSMLSRIRSIETNIMTLEEPIEYHFDLVRQTSVQERHGIGFVDGVRGILRQDPDVIFIGEVRDPGTAQMALRAAMTGHQVFSTLHCNDALGALPRLIDLGLHPRMLAGHVGGVVAQRLVRKLCPHCRALRPAAVEESRILRGKTPVVEIAAHAHAGFAEAQSPFAAVDAEPMIGVAVGCEYCFGTGYRGRVAIAEVLRVTPEIDELIAADAPRAAFAQPLCAQGFQSLVDDGINRVLKGEIAFESLRRAVDLTRIA